MIKNLPKNTEKGLTEKRFINNLAETAQLTYLCITTLSSCPNQWFPEAFLPSHKSNKAKK
jgi:hypothetical protein